MTMMRTPATTLATAAALLVIAGAAITGCGQAKAGGGVPLASTGGAAASGGRPGPETASGSPGALPPTAFVVCSGPRAVSTVKVTRIPGLPRRGEVLPRPATLPGITIADRAKAVALARAICALPLMPRGMLGLSCPMDTGSGFLLVFANADLRFPPVRIHTSGCETVTGASHNRPRWIPASGGFWITFSRLTGIKAPSNQP